MKLNESWWNSIDNTAARMLAQKCTLPLLKCSRTRIVGDCSTATVQREGKCSVAILKNGAVLCWIWRSFSGSLKILTSKPKQWGMQTEQVCGMLFVLLCRTLCCLHRIHPDGVGKKTWQDAGLVGVDDRHFLAKGWTGLNLHCFADVSRRGVRYADDWMNT